MVRSGPHLALPLKQTCRFSGDAAGARSRLSGSPHHSQPKEMLRLSPKRIRYLYLLIKKKKIIIRICGQTCSPILQTLELKSDILLECLEFLPALF